MTGIFLRLKKEPPLGWGCLRRIGGGGHSPHILEGTRLNYFKRSEENLSCSLKPQNTILRDGGTHLHLLVVGGHNHIYPWDGGHSPPLYLLFCAIYWFRWPRVFSVFNFALVLMIQIQLKIVFAVTPFWAIRWSHILVKVQFIGFEIDKEIGSLDLTL